MESCSAASVCFCKANTLFAKEFINLSDSISKPLCALFGSLALNPLRVVAVFRASQN